LTDDIDVVVGVVLNGDKFLVERKTIMKLRELVR